MLSHHITIAFPSNPESIRPPLSPWYPNTETFFDQPICFISVVHHPDHRQAQPRPPLSPHHQRHDHPRQTTMAPRTNICYTFPTIANTNVDITIATDIIATNKAKYKNNNTAAFVCPVFTPRYIFFVSNSRTRTKITTGSHPRVRHGHNHPQQTSKIPKHPTQAKKKLNLTSAWTPNCPRRSDLLL
ncbi:pollen-specific leucine-rich repeat extensin-like protein 4 [Iris pallida]|uniref:Pollen-specific leucine-rich repeat extensin-like protein 4 n=1 Tax=Iris pallida TaxID=29817 RepID=A0AAX6GUT3_IRIPA|nr:pollen-specific leucine-rich repeat extensin-like protein 4 [Iris pallida]